MDTARQVIRWALPGWIALLFWTGFIFVNTALYGQDQKLYLGILAKVGESLLPLAAAAIPLGFIIYQLYHWMYWFAPVPSLFGRRFVDPVDRGKEILDAVKDRIDFKQVFDHPLHIDTPKDAFVKYGPLSYKSTKIMAEYRQNWNLADSVWYLALSDEKYRNTADFLERRHQLLGDIYHSLGASYYAVALAYLGYVLAFGYVALVEVGVIPPVFASLSPGATTFTGMMLRLISFTINSAIFLLGTRILRGGRMASFDALLALKHDVITNVMLDRPTKALKERDTSRW